MNGSPLIIKRRSYEYGFHDPEEYFYRAKPGLSREVVVAISAHKKEPKWMREFRLKALATFESKPMPTWGGNLSKIDFQNIFYYIKPTEKQGRTWEDVPANIKKTFERIGIPEAERKFLAGVGAQYDSEVIYHSIEKHLRKLGVIFTDTDTAVRRYPKLVREYFGTLIPPADNKFAALNSAVWSGGSFVYVPKGIKVDLPLQAYFRINAERMGQFERTLIIAEEGSSVHYVEGCSAPTYSADALHAAVVEIIVKPGASVRYTTIQNWAPNVYNLVTKRAKVLRDGHMSWIDANLGSQLTMKYPSCYLMEPGAKGETLSIAVAGKGQHQDAGAKMIHVAPNTSSIITSKSISFEGGRTSYRGLVQVHPTAEKANVHVRCDALILDRESRSDTY
ncbi:MAG: Fe-S cluster assembly protein SufB, partial [Parcubacteria group bacterium]|nr:Fe-S cluster assembly protein SufB [Parcubacteria group bacterium]